MKNTDTQSKGTYKVCGRCSGTGEARYNHANGDTHCYQCNGAGIIYQASAAEKARKEREQAWYSNVMWAARYGNEEGRRNHPHIVSRAARQATETTPWLPKAEREALSADELAAYEAAQAADRVAARELERRINYFVEEGLDAAMQEVYEDEQARTAADMAAAKQDPTLAKRVETAIARRAARESARATA